ncbi:uncharacterized protein LOC129728511 [Wyeomyia smithii]|uniref:uncharacterized protein LOC129728511 n=1 Tax=Wyeomyia smithii TaxID=174621 RepID=UPI002467DBE1|nr:uncharacterized protein LOC129728511 [Wyeomyia smithii]
MPIANKQVKSCSLDDLSIPRKELCAAQLLARLLDKVISTINVNFKLVTLWSDSQIVLAWLKKHPSQLEVFVRNRVTQISKLTQNYECRHVPSQLNPADIISRGQLPFTLTENRVWWNGPDFLNESIITMEPCEEVSDSELPELKPAIISTIVIIELQLPVFERYSSFRKLQRVIAWILRYVNNSRKQKTNRILEKRLNTDELRQSMLVIVRVIQHIELGDEIQRLQSNRPCKRIGSLNPIYANDVLRVGGRLNNAHIPDESKHQLILPHTNSVTKLLIRTMHIEQLHVGPTGLLAAIRQRFWLTNARATVRNVTRLCVKCFKVNPTNEIQLMGQLSKQRVTPSQIFSIVGVDYAGPIIVKQGTYRPKNNQETEIDRIVQFCQTKEIKWNFIPPDAPEFGGLWEAAVKSTKTHLKRVIGNAVLTFEEMTTTLCEIEAILNSRPLFAVSNHPADPEVITPAHFLIGRPMNAIPEPSYNEVKINRLSRWQHCQLMREHFWRAWSKDYLMSLQPRKKNWMTIDNVRPGMVVLLHDKTRTPLIWKLGRVTAVHPGPDGLVRAVDILSEGSVYRRPITKLSILPIEDNQRLRKKSA